MGQQQQTFLIIPKPRKQNNFSRKHTTKKSREEKERTQINISSNEKGEDTTDTTEIQSIIREYCKQIYSNKMDILEEMDKFSERYISRLKQEETNYKWTNHK